MIRRMKYPGGKGKTYQHVINLMPPHRVYIETHVGGGAVLRHKLPAARSIAIDADDRVIAHWRAMALPGVQLVHGRAEDFLARHAFEGDELVYVDPPYHPETRRQPRIYRHEYGAADHEALLALLATLPCRVIVSPFEVRETSSWCTSATFPSAHEEPHFHFTAVPVRIAMRTTVPRAPGTRTAPRTGRASALPAARRSPAPRPASDRGCRASAACGCRTRRPHPGPG